MFWTILSDGAYRTELNSFDNISMHALNSVFAGLEIILPRSDPHPWLLLVPIIIILALYLGLAYLTHATEGFYVYSFLDMYVYLPCSGRDEANRLVDNAMEVVSLPAHVSGFSSELLLCLLSFDTLYCSAVGSRRPSCTCMGDYLLIKSRTMRMAEQMGRMRCPVYQSKMSDHLPRAK